MAFERLPSDDCVLYKSDPYAHAYADVGYPHQDVSYEECLTMPMYPMVHPQELPHPNYVQYDSYDPMYETGVSHARSIKYEAPSFLTNFPTYYEQVVPRPQLIPYPRPVNSYYASQHYNVQHQNEFVQYQPCSTRSYVPLPTQQQQQHTVGVMNQGINTCPPSPSEHSQTSPMSSPRSSPVRESLPSPVKRSGPVRRTKSKTRSAPYNRRNRKTRAKVVLSKGAVQCKGRNKKKNERCRNAALMEFIGPRPQFCAEHIEQDPVCLYKKCCASYQKVEGDGKRCKEVVLKEFGFCHKHLHEAFRGKEDDVVVQQTCTKMLERVSQLLSDLENEAAAAKKFDADLYQRKHKLIPKFQSMKETLLKSCKYASAVSPSTTEQHTADSESCTEEDFQLYNCHQNIIDMAA